MGPMLLCIKVVYTSPYGEIQIIFPSRFFLILDLFACYITLLSMIVFFPPLLPSNLGENCFNLCCMIWKVSLILNLDSYPTSVMLTWDEFRTSRTCGCEVTFVSLYTHLSFFYAEYSGLTKRKQRRWIHLSEVNFRASAKSWKSTWLYIYIDIDTDNLGPPLWHNWTSQALHSSSFFFLVSPTPVFSSKSSNSESYN